MANNLNVDESTIDTVLAGDINFSGVLKFSKELMIKGKFEGEIDAIGHLIIGPGAVVKAQIKAGVVSNYGTVIGNIIATKHVELLNNASLVGDIVTPEIYIDNGCRFNGCCSMPDEKNKNKSEENKKHN